MSLYQKLDCVCKYWVHTLHKQLLYDKLDKIQATTNNKNLDRMLS